MSATYRASLAAIYPIMGLLAGCEEVPRTYSTQAVAGEQVFSDDFDRAELGPSWTVTGPGASIEDGKLVVAGLRNHPLWLAIPLPDDVRISFDAWAATEEGDIKVEFAGDGKSVATSANYVATGYVFVFGGWNNSLNVIARKDEHARDRITTNEPLVEPDKRYHMVIWRTGTELRWEINGREIASMNDPSPLKGDGHRHFAFGGWETEVHFDNLVIEAI